MDEVGDGKPHAVALHNGPLVGEIDPRDLEVLRRDVPPDVELGPVADGEDPHVLALADPAVVQAPELGALVARIPRSERVAMAEDPLLGARLLLVAPAAPEQRVEAMLRDRVEQRHGLEPVARRIRSGFLADASRRDRVLDRRDDESLADLCHAPVAELQDRREVVAGVHVQDRERESPRPKRLLGEAEQHQRVLAPREEERGPLEDGRRFAKDVDRLCLEDRQVVDRGPARNRHGKRGHRATSTSLDAGRTAGSAAAERVTFAGEPRQLPGEPGNRADDQQDGPPRRVGDAALRERRKVDEANLLVGPARGDHDRDRGRGTAAGGEEIPPDGAPGPSRP